MDNNDLLSSLFAEHMELHSVCASTAMPQILLASEAIANCLLRDKKILSCSSGSGNYLAQMFCTHLIEGFDEERPALPAIYLAPDNNGDIAKQINAFGSEGDTLVILACKSDEALIKAIHTARQRNICIILCTNSDTLMTQLSELDITIPLPAANSLRNLEMQTTIIHALCQLIDSHIFGGTA
jgi:D-sedoheptulose 7-phosphate isomerase